MKKRLLLLAVAVILLCGMAVASYASYITPEFHPYRTFNGASGAFSISPTQTNSSVIKVVLEGDFEALNSDNPYMIAFNCSIDGVTLYNIQTRFTEAGTQLIAYYYYDYHVGNVYDFVFNSIGGGTVDSTKIYIYTLQTDGNYQDGYNDGLEDGTNNNELVGNAIEGFFDGLVAFMTLILDIGIGVLTIRNLVGVCVITLLIVTIIKIIRGE